MKKAREVQAGFLPRSSAQLATLECAALTLPVEGVGGDSFDFLKPSPRRLAMTVADISGKGVPAALMSASLQASLRSHYALGAGDLAGRLESMNRLFYDCTASGHFATLFLGEYDDRTRRLRYANCGHLPPLLLRADGAHEWLPPTAAVLGIAPDWTCAIADTVLSPGDVLLLYTDGATEAMNGAREEFGETRLASALYRSRRLPPAELLDALVREVRGFCGGALADDLTFVLARPKAPVAPGRLFVRSCTDEVSRNGTGGSDADLHPSR
jgi:sigma-B regulation protein RsbU (phosphoserine phosphatase)